ncbi:hypothetical protein GpartN1_g6599.t1 [Galdieria partita]|uniref:Homeobox domain-containing protein n=1 Tax=Galdieria partita TaxID=83374 RepID=A0A9C7Q1L7_9RHOD|nr:hypothetical protein GpartN1_g6599.t1 [Galdieria partita]
MPTNPHKLVNHIVYLENVLSQSPFLLPSHDLVTRWDPNLATTHSETQNILQSLNRLSSTRYDWDIFQAMDENEALSFTQRVMCKEWLIDWKTRWNDTMNHYASLMWEELKQQCRFRTVTEEELQSWIHAIVEIFENAWNTLRQMIHNGRRMKPHVLVVRQKDARMILIHWFLQHAFEPYPSEEEKEWLAMQTGWTVQQVNHWFINTRVRIWKPIITQLQQEVTTLSYHHQP